MPQAYPDALPDWLNFESDFAMMRTSRISAFFSSPFGAMR
jgi:hypothetical protein